MMFSVAAMTAGVNFISVVNASTSVTVELHDVIMWYERDEWKLGSLYWCDVGSRTKLVSQSFPLHRVSDVFLDKRTAELKGQALSEYPSPECFSIVGRCMALHLVAPSEAVRTSWLQAVRDLFRLPSTRQIRLDGWHGNGSSILDRSSQQSLSAQPTSGPIRPSPSMAAITAGANMTSVVGPPSHPFSMEMGKVKPSSSALTPVPSQLIQSPVFVWYEQDETSMGSLYWCDVGTKKRLVNQSISLHRVTDVLQEIMLGRLEEWEQLLGYASHCHFSLISRNRLVYLSHHQRR